MPQGRPKTDIDGEFVAKWRDHKDRLTWDKVAEKCKLQYGFKPCLSVVRMVYAEFRATQPPIQCPKPDPEERMWYGGKRGQKPALILNRNLVDGSMRCKGMCRELKSPKEFSADRTMPHGVYLHSRCRACVKRLRSAGDKINRRLMGLDKTPEELKEEEANRPRHDKPGRPRKIDTAVAWHLNIAKGMKRSEIAKYMNVSLGGLNAAMDRIDIEKYEETDLN